MKKSCRNCAYEVWAIGIGQGVFCHNINNLNVNLGFGLRKGGMPYLPASKDFLCEHYLRERFPGEVFEDEEEEH